MPYVKNGDIFEWHWGKGEEPDKFGGTKPDFDPTSAPAPGPSPAEGPPRAVEPVVVELEEEEAPPKVAAVPVKVAAKR
jgi:hypothetical protein